jgi:metal-responsive CopG/Arc/MetJ family transcriptional regulator
MSARFNLVLSDDLNRAIDSAVEDSETTKSEVIRKALQLYLAARDGNRRGLKVGLFDPRSDKMQTEFVGL